MDVEWFRVMLSLLLLLVFPSCSWASKVIEVFTQIPAGQMADKSQWGMKMTVYSRCCMIRCFELPNQQIYISGSHISFKFLGQVFQYTKDSENVIPMLHSVLHMETCYNMDTNIINIEDSRFEVLLKSGKWAYFDKGDRKELKYSQMQPTVWRLQSPQGFLPASYRSPVNDVSSNIPLTLRTKTIGDGDRVMTIYSQHGMITCFELKTKEKFPLNEDIPIRYIEAKFVALLYTKITIWDVHIVSAALYMEACDHMLGNIVNLNEKEFEVQLSNSKWARKGKSFQSSELLKTAWTFQKPQRVQPKRESSEVVDIVKSRSSSAKIDNTLKITMYTTGYMIKCFQQEEGDKGTIVHPQSRKSFKSAAIIYQTLPASTDAKAIIFLNTCSNMDRNVINIKDNKFEVLLSNNRWAYFEDFESKSKRYLNSVLPPTVWKLQLQETPNDLGASEVESSFTYLQPPFTGIQSILKMTAYYKEYVMKCYEINPITRYTINEVGQPQRIIEIKFMAIIHSEPEWSAVKHLKACLLMKSCDNMDRNLVNLDDIKLEVRTQNNQWHYYSDPDLERTFDGPQLTPAIWSLQKLEDREVS